MRGKRYGLFRAFKPDLQCILFLFFITPFYHHSFYQGPCSKRCLSDRVHRQNFTMEERAVQTFGYKLGNCEELAGIEYSSGPFLSIRNMLLNAFQHLHVEFEDDELPVIHCRQTSWLCDICGENYKLTLNPAMKEAILMIAVRQKINDCNFENVHLFIIPSFPSLKKVPECFYFSMLAKDMFLNRT